MSGREDKRRQNGGGRERKRGVNVKWKKSGRGRRHRDGIGRDKGRGMNVKMRKNERGRRQSWSKKRKRGKECVKKEGQEDKNVPLFGRQVEGGRVRGGEGSVQEEKKVE